MATVYKVEIELVSPWTNYTPKQVKDIMMELIEKRLLEKKFENIEVKAERKVHIPIRNLAMEWWDILPTYSFAYKKAKVHLTKKYFGDRSSKSLTGREIESIYKQEHQNIN